MPHPSFPVRAALSALCLAGAAAVPSAPALAQGVTLYGLLDASVEHLTDVGQGGASLNRMPGLTGSVPSRIGLRGSEDLGGGLRALFTMEQGLALDAGVLNQGGRAWGRQAFVGLSGDWGSLTLGRQYTMLYWSQLDADILGPNAYGAASLDSYLPNARADNALAWRAGLGGFTVGATYSLGRDAVNAGPGPAGTNCPGEQPGDSSACRQWSAMLKYEAKAWGIALAVDEIRGGPGAFRRPDQQRAQGPSLHRRGMGALGGMEARRRGHCPPQRRPSRRATQRSLVSGRQFRRHTGPDPRRAGLGSAFQAKRRRGPALCPAGPVFAVQAHHAVCDRRASVQRGSTCAVGQQCGARRRARPRAFAERLRCRRAA